MADSLKLSPSVETQVAEDARAAASSAAEARAAANDAQAVASTMPDTYTDAAAGYASQAETSAAAAQSSADIAAQVAAAGAVGIYNTAADGLAATVNGDFFAVAGKILELYRNDNGAATFISRYPAAERLSIGGLAGDSVRERPDYVRIDGNGLATINRGSNAVGGPMAFFANLSGPPVSRLGLTVDGRFVEQEPGGMRRMSINGLWGVTTEEQATGVFSPPAPHGVGADWSLGNVALSNSLMQGVVEGAVPQDIVATVSGSTSFSVGMLGASFDLNCQIDIVIRPEIARKLLIRLPNGVSPTDLGGGGFTIAIDLDTGEWIANDPAMDMEPPYVISLANGFKWVKFRFNSATPTTGTAYIYAKSALTTGRKGTFNLDDRLFVLDAMCIQHSASHRAPPIPGAGMGVTIDADTASVDLPTVDVNGVQIEVAFSTKPFQTGDVIVAKLSGTANSVNGVAIEHSPGRVRGVVAGPGGTVSAELPVDVQPVRAALRMVDGQATLFVGEDRATFDYSATNIPSGELQELFLHGSGLGAGAPGTYPVIHDLIVGAAGESDLSFAARRAPTPMGESAAGTPGGDTLLRREASGRLLASLAERTVEDIRLSRSAAALTGIDDISVMQITRDGLVGTTNAPGLPITYKVRYSHRDGLAFAWTPNRVFAIWAGGQSLAYANTYGNPVNWPSCPLFVDVQDGVYNSVFGNSTAGWQTDVLQEPVISQDPVGGAGGLGYPALHRFVRENTIMPALTIGKTIAKSGAKINELWPWGLYDSNGNPLPNAETTIWDNVQRWYASVGSVAARFGFQVEQPFFLWLHGTADKNTPDYYQRLEWSFSDLKDTVRTHFGQEAPPVWVMTQSGGRTNTSDSRWTVCEHQIDFASDYARRSVCLAAPIYPGEYVLADDNVHLDYPSTTLVGELLGIAMKEILLGNKWTIGNPTITQNGNQIVVSFSDWLRHDEALEIAPDLYYNGIGVDNQGFELLQIVDTGTTGILRYGGAAAAITDVSIGPDGTSIVITTDVAPSGPQGWVLQYAFQAQDLTANHNGRYAHRGLIRTTWRQRSAILPNRSLYRWVPSFRKEFI